MAWNVTETVPAPLDRIIEVTSGGAWGYEDTYHPRDARSRPHTTVRNWQFRGGVALVFWQDASVLGGDWPAGGAWIETTSGNVFPGFRFWREYDNPLAGHDDLLTSCVLPFEISQDFEGDARLRLYDQMEESMRRLIASVDHRIERDTAHGHPTLPVTTRVRASYEEKLARIVAARLHAYDPHDLPSGVQGVAK